MVELSEDDIKNSEGGDDENCEIDEEKIWKIMKLFDELFTVI